MQTKSSERSLSLALSRFGLDSIGCGAAAPSHQLVHDSLPVFTLANPERVLHDKASVELIAETLLERWLDIDLYRGVGRIYLP